MKSDTDQMSSITAPAPITALTADEYGHRVSISTLSKEIIVLSAQTLTPEFRIAITDSTPVSLAYSSSETSRVTLLAAGFTDGSVRLYDTNREVKRFEPRRSSILSLAFHPTRPLLAAASLDGTFSVYSRASADWSTVSVPASVMGLTAIVWGSDADLILTLIVGCVDGTVRIYKTAGGGWESSRALQIHSGWVRAISVPRVPLGLYQKIGTVGDDDFAAVIKLGGNDEVAVARVGPLGSPASSAGWALVDKVLVLSHANGETSFWRETESGAWEKSAE
jgi:WD40 repeat protein